VVVAGGRNSSNKPLDSVEIYYPEGASLGDRAAVAGTGPERIRDRIQGRLPGRRRSERQRRDAEHLSLQLEVRLEQDERRTASGKDHWCHRPPGQERFLHGY